MSRWEYGTDKHGYSVWTLKEDIDEVVTPPYEGTSLQVSIYLNDLYLEISDDVGTLPMSLKVSDVSGLNHILSHYLATNLLPMELENEC